MNPIWITITVLCIGALLVWFILSLRRLRKSRFDVERARNQLAQYRLLQTQAKEDENYQTQVEISEVIYGDVICSYNRALQKSPCRILGRILGFYPIRGDNER